MLKPGINVTFIRELRNVRYANNLLVCHSSLAHKSNFVGHVIVTTGLRRMHFPRPGFFSEMELEPAAG